MYSQSNSKFLSSLSNSSRSSSTSGVLTTSAIEYKVLLVQVVYLVLVVYY